MGLLWLLIWLLPGHRGWFDIGVYHGAVNYWVHEGGQIYNYVRVDSTYGFTYPPFAAIVMVPMALFPWHAAIGVSFLLTTAAAAFLLWLLIDPIIQREGWPRAYSLGVAACLFMALAPVRDTFLYGQINLLLMALVYFDLWMLTTGKRRWAGVGIGLAAAIKLTPGIFILYLLFTKRWRTAIIASVTTAVATVISAIAAPDAFRTYFTELLWDTSRIGALEYVSNQSLMGMVARLIGPGFTGKAIWFCLMAMVLIFWAYRVRQSDIKTGFALTGLAGCLISPITWVHHLVWAIPALIILAHNPATRRMTVYFYVMLVSSMVWLWHFDASGVLAFFGSNAYMFITLVLLFKLPAIWPVPAYERYLERRRPVVIPPAHALRAAGLVPAAESAYPSQTQVLASGHARHIR